MGRVYEFLANNAKRILGAVMAITGLCVIGYAVDGFLGVLIVLGMISVSALILIGLLLLFDLL